jgi:hypothetical protein
MLWWVKRDPEHAQALARVREWTRTRFALEDDDSVLVTELACGLPGCPPLETVVAFWSGGRRHHYKFFKRAAEVALDDFPPRWMKDALAVPDEFEIDCGC